MSVPRFINAQTSNRTHVPGPLLSMPARVPEEARAMAPNGDLVRYDPGAFQEVIGALDQFEASSARLRTTIVHTYQKEAWNMILRVQNVRLRCRTIRPLGRSSAQAAIAAGSDD